MINSLWTIVFLLFALRKWLTHIFNDFLQLINSFLQGFIFGFQDCHFISSSIKLFHSLSFQGVYLLSLTLSISKQFVNLCVTHIENVSGDSYRFYLYPWNVCLCNHVKINDRVISMNVRLDFSHIDSWAQNSNLE